MELNQGDEFESKWYTSVLLTEAEGFTVEFTVAERAGALLGGSTPYPLSN